MRFSSKSEFPTHTSEATQGHLKDQSSLLQVQVFVTAKARLTICYLKQNIAPNNMGLEAKPGSWVQSGTQQQSGLKENKAFGLKCFFFLEIYLPDQFRGTESVPEDKTQLEMCAHWLLWWAVGKPAPVDLSTQCPG